MIPSLSPTLGVLAVTSLVILVSNSFSGIKKIAFQAFFFIAGVVGAMTYLITRKDEAIMRNFLKSFSQLDQELRIAISVLVIGVCYFGGAMYLGGPPMSEGNATSTDLMPASIDSSVDFEVPDNLPTDDKDFFQLMFTK